MHLSCKCTADPVLKPLSLIILVGQVSSFLVRPSDNTPGDYSLFFRTNENIQRFKISPTPNNQYMMGGRYYNRYVYWWCWKFKIFTFIAFCFCSNWCPATCFLFSVWQCWRRHWSLQERTNSWGLQPERTSFSSGRGSCSFAGLCVRYNAVTFDNRGGLMHYWQARTQCEHFPV